MKTKILFLLLMVVASVTSFSQRVLTDEERESLKSNGTFLYRAEWAVRNYAEYWSAHDGAGLANTEAARIKWAKDRILSVNIVLGGVNDPQLTLRFINISKGMQFTIGAAPQPAETIIAAFIADNRFDEIAGTYFTLLGDGINFSIGN
jgi:hypothetical protein